MEKIALLRKTYGLQHSKKYIKSVVADFLVNSSTDDEDKEVKINSDINLLLRQKTIHRSVGIDLLRDYVQNLQRENSEQYNFSDDELFSMIEPREINNLTTMYEYARYMQDNSKQIKSKFEELVKSKEKYYESLKTLNSE